MILLKKTQLFLLFCLCSILCSGQKNSAYLEAPILENLGSHPLIKAYNPEDASFTCLDKRYKESLTALKKFSEAPLEFDNLDIAISDLIKDVLEVDFNKCSKLETKIVLLDSTRNNNTAPKNEKSTATNTGYTLTTSLIDGTAKFLVNRTKKEIALTFYENFESKINRNYSITLNNGQYGTKVTFKLSDIFPNTILLLGNKDSFETPSLGQTWIAAFKRDIANMPEQILQILLNSNFANSEIGQSIQASFKFINLIKDGNSLERTVSLLSNTYNRYDDFDLHRFIGLLNMTLYNLKDENGEIITYDTFRNLDTNTKIIYVGVLFQKLKKQGIIPEKFILNEKYVLEKIIPNLLNLTNEVENISKKVKLIYDTDGNLNIESFINFATSSLELSIISSQLVEDIFSANSANIRLRSHQLLNIIKPIKSIYVNFGEKDYGASLLTTIGFLDTLLQQSEQNQEIKRLITYYGNFLVDVISAAQKDSKVEIADVLNSYALPVSSYRIKRQFHKSVDISAYPGIMGGYEFSGSNSFSFGITAPIGISLSWKANQNLPVSKQSASNSIFFSAIDLGAPFSYRFANGDAEGLPENIKLDQIFSPGLFFVKGLKNSPFALSFGGQFSPLLRNIKNDANQFEEKNIFRVSIGLTVDIPLFNLNRKSKTTDRVSINNNSKDVLYGERSSVLIPDQDTFQLFYDKEGQLYPKSFIPNDVLSKNNGLIQNYFFAHNDMFKNISKQNDLNFDDYSYQNYLTLQERLSDTYAEQINNSLKDSTLVFVLIHGFRKPLTPQNNDSSSIQDNKSVKEVIRNELGTNNDIKFIEIYWNGTYDCCITKNVKRNKEIFNLFEIDAQNHAFNTGHGLRRMISKLKTNQLNIITHSLGAQVGVTSLFNAYEDKTILHTEHETPSQKEVNICLLAPAMSEEPFKNYYDRKTDVNYTENDNYNLTVIYNEDDIVLKKKVYKVFGPGSVKYGNTSLGCNCKNAIPDLETTFQTKYKNSNVTTLETNIGGVHYFKSYAESDQFKDYLRSLD